MCSDIPKQYIEVNGHMIIEYTLKAMLNWKTIDSLVIVAADEWQKKITKMLSETAFFGAGISKVFFLGFASPGENRQLSIKNALEHIEDKMSDDARIMIHDAARPLTPEPLLERMEKAGCETDADGVMPYLPMKDTVYESRDGIHISRNLNRNEIFAGQTPEYFDYNKYKAAVDALSESGIMSVHGSTEPAVAAGMNVVMVPGDETNIKITTPKDMDDFINIIKNDRGVYTD